MGSFDGHVKEYLGNYDAYCRQKNWNSKHNIMSIISIKRKRKLQESYAKKQAQAQKSSHVSKTKQKQIKPSRLAGSKQKDTVQKALQNKRKRLMPELTDYPMLRKQNKSEKLFFLLIISSLYTIHIQLELKI